MHISIAGLIAKRTTYELNRTTAADSYNRVVVLTRNKRRAFAAQHTSTYTCTLNFDRVPCDHGQFSNEDEAMQFFFNKYINAPVIMVRRTR